MTRHNERDLRRIKERGIKSHLMNPPTHLEHHVMSERVEISLLIAFCKGTRFYKKFYSNFRKCTQIFKIYYTLEKFCKFFLFVRFFSSVIKSLNFLKPNSQEA